MVDSKRFWMAPKLERRSLTTVRAESIRFIAVSEFDNAQYVNTFQRAGILGDRCCLADIRELAGHDDVVSGRQC